MRVTIKSKIPVEIDVDDIILMANINNGDSVSVIRDKIFNYLDSTLCVPEDMETNIKDISDIILDEIKDKLYYYILY